MHFTGSEAYTIRAGLFNQYLLNSFVKLYFPFVREKITKMHVITNKFWLHVHVHFIFLICIYICKIVSYPRDDRNFLDTQLPL
jgi:hypothetical protein